MSSKSAIIPNLCDIDVNDIQISDVPKTLDNGGKIIFVQMGGKPLIFKVPAMTLPYGMSDWEGTKFHIDLSLSETNPEITEFKNKFIALESKIIDTAYEKCMPWFKKQYKSREVVEELYSSAIKYSKDKATGEISNKYPPTVKFQIPFVKGKFTCDAYNFKKEAIEISKETVNKGAKVTSLVHLSGLWIAGSKIGATYKVVQMKVKASESNVISGYAFVDDDDLYEDI